MLYYVLRRDEDKEPLALIKINAKERGNMVILPPRPSRFGLMCPVTRMGHHVYNLFLGDNEEIETLLSSVSGYRLEEVTQSEWESFDVFELFPVLRLAVAR